MSSYTINESQAADAERSLKQHEGSPKSYGTMVTMINTFEGEERARVLCFLASKSQGSLRPLEAAGAILTTVAKRRYKTTGERSRREAELARFINSAVAESGDLEAAWTSLTKDAGVSEGGGKSAQDYLAQFRG